MGVTILLVEQNARAAVQAAYCGYAPESGGISLKVPSRNMANDNRPTTNAP